MKILAGVKLYLRKATVAPARLNARDGQLHPVDDIEPDAV